METTFNIGKPRKTYKSRNSLYVNYNGWRVHLGEFPFCLNGIKHTYEWVKTAEGYRVQIVGEHR